MSNRESIGTFILFLIVGYPTCLLGIEIFPSLIVKFNFSTFCFFLVFSSIPLFFFYVFISTFLSERHDNWLLQNGQKVKAKITEVIKIDMGEDGYKYYFICQTKLENKTQFQFKSKIIYFDPTGYSNAFFGGEVDVYLNNSNTNDYFIDLRNY